VRVDAVHAGAVLGVAGQTSPAALRRAYREQLRRVHPDTGSGDIRSLNEVRAAYRELQPQVAPVAAASPWDERPQLGMLVDLYA
jgi:hypothetical protein